MIAPMITLHLNFADVAVFLAILLRLSIIVFLLPILSSAQVPNMWKAGCAIALTATLYPLLRQTVSPLSFEPADLLMVATGELIFGLIFSFSVDIVFSSFQFAGELISFEMGFGFAQTADPQSGAQSTLISMWFQLTATLLFLAMNGHHILLKSVVESFRTIPLGGFALTPEIYNKVIGYSLYLFIIAIKVAAPVMVVLLLTQVGLGLMAKFAPQFNILMTSFPLTIFLGLLFMGFSVLVWGEIMQRFLKELFQFIHVLAT